MLCSNGSYSYSSISSTSTTSHYRNDGYSQQRSTNDRRTRPRLFVKPLYSVAVPVDLDVSTALKTFNALFDSKKKKVTYLLIQLNDFTKANFPAKCLKAFGVVWCQGWKFVPHGLTKYSPEPGCKHIPNHASCC